MEKVNCANCNKELFKYPYQIKNSKKKIFVCSKKCYSNYSSKIKVKCKQCKKEFDIWPFVHNSSKNKEFFCSRKCHYKYGQPSRRGIPRSQNIKDKISKANKGKPMPEHQRKIMSKLMKKRFKEYKETGIKSHIFGRKLTLEERKKRSETVKGRKMPESQKKKISLSNKGKKRSKESIFKTSGKNHYNWKGGLSHEEYGLEFNEKLKRQIRKRDNYRCQQCFRHQDELFSSTGKRYKLNIHHIDYNKKNNIPTNLISLCRNCHTQTNFKREDWTKYFNKKVGELL